MQDMAFDAPDERDIQMEELVGSIYTNDSVPDEILPDYKTPVLNQGRTKRCTLFSVSHAINEMNYIEANAVGVDTAYLQGTEFVKLAEEKYGYSEKRGGFVQSAIKLFRDQGEIAGYASIEKTREAIKLAIANGKKICTGSNKIDWRKTGFTAVIGKGDGHAFPILYYSRIGPLVKDSGGEKHHDRGYFTIRWEDIGNLFTCYALLDDDDAPALWSKRAIKEGITTQEFLEFRPKDWITRMEVALFVSRYFKVDQMKLWNAMRPNDLATLYEVSVMIARAKGVPEPLTKKEGDDVLLQRWETIKMIMGK